MFGSYGRIAAPSDVDLLFVYDETNCTAVEAIAVRSRLEEAVARLVGLPVHVVLLSDDEERSVGFIEAEGCLPADEVFRSVLNAKRADQIIRAVVHTTQPERIL